MILFLLTASIFAMIGLVLRLSENYDNVGVIYYFVLSMFTLFMTFALP